MVSGFVTTGAVKPLPVRRSCSARGAPGRFRPRGRPSTRNPEHCHRGRWIPLRSVQSYCQHERSCAVFLIRADDSQRRSADGWPATEVLRTSPCARENRSANRPPSAQVYGPGWLCRATDPFGWPNNTVLRDILRSAHCAPSTAPVGRSGSFMPVGTRYRKAMVSPSFAAGRCWWIKRAERPCPVRTSRSRWNRCGGRQRGKTVIPAFVVQRRTERVDPERKGRL